MKPSTARNLTVASIVVALGAVAAFAAMARPTTPAAAAPSADAEAIVRAATIVTQDSYLCGESQGPTANFTARANERIRSIEGSLGPSESAGDTDTPPPPGNSRERCPERATPDFGPDARAVLSASTRASAFMLDDIEAKRIYDGILECAVKDAPGASAGATYTENIENFHMRLMSTRLDASGIEEIREIERQALDFFTAYERCFDDNARRALVERSNEAYSTTTPEERAAADRIVATRPAGAEWKAIEDLNVCVRLNVGDCRNAP